LASTRRRRKPRKLSESRPQVRTRSRPFLVLLTLGAALLGGGILRGAQTSPNRTLISDEGISYLAATGHQAEYSEIVANKRHPYGAWAKASEWKRLINIEGKFCFGQIGADLASKDIHPPLYFWLLHLWTMVVGVHLWTGPSLNILIAAVTTVALFGLGREVTGNPVYGAFVAFIWAVSPTVIPTSIQARQYDLLGLCTTLFVWQVVRCSNAGRPGGWKPLVLLGVFTSAALLTYYHAVLLVFGCGLLLLMRLLRRNRRRLAYCCLSIGAGCAAFVLLHPGFLHSVDRARAQAQPFSPEELTYRLERVLTRYTSFFVDTSILHGKTRTFVEYFVLVLFALVSVKLIVACLQDWRAARRSRSETDSVRFHLFLLFLWAATTNILLYVSCASPRHAMEPKHPSMVYPLLALSTILILHSFRRGRTILMSCLCLVLLATAAQSVLHRRDAARGTRPPSAALAGADTIIIDNLSRLILPSAMVHFPDDLGVFAASQKDLLAHPARWVDRLGDKSLCISGARSKQERARLDAMLRLLIPKYDVAQFKGGIGGRGMVLRLTRRAPSR